MDVIEYKRTCSEFLRLASNMLRSTYEMKNVHLVRFRSFIEQNPLVSSIITRKIQGVTCEQGIISSTNGFWLATRTPYDEAEQIRGIYDHLIEMTEEPCDLTGIASKFPLKSNNLNDKIQNYLNKVYKPLVDFVVDELKREAIDMENSEKNGITINIEKNMGTTNVGNGNIQSINIVNGAIDNNGEIKVLIEKLVSLLQESELDDETMDEVIDDLDTISEQINLEQPKKVKVKKAFEGIKQFVTKIPQGLTNATAIASCMNGLIEEVGNVLSHLK